MAINFLNNVDYNKNQLLNPRIQNEPSDIAAGTPTEGQLYYNTTSNVLKVGREVTPVTTPPTYQWAEVSSSYGFTLSDDANPAVTGAISSGDTIKIAATEDLTSNLTGQATTSKQLEIGLNVDGGAGVENNYIVNQGSATAAADDTIPFSDYTDNVDPALDTYVVKKTTFGTIPVEALTLVKNYIDSSVTGGLIYQGGFDGSTGFVTGTSDYLDNRTGSNQIAVNKGWTYTVTAAGTFYGEVVEVGDVLIAEDDLASGAGALTDWTTVQNNIGFATAGTDTGGGAAIVGISRYDEDDFIVSSTGFVRLNSASSFSGTIGDGSATSIRLENSEAVAPNINHGMGTDSTSFMIQLVDVSSGETVYADVTRGAGGQVTIDFASAPAVAGIRVLIQKIG